MRRQIRHRYNFSVLFECDADSVKIAVKLAIEAKADLSWADLSRANLQVESPRRELSKMTAENKRMRPALQWAYDVLNHGEIPVPRKGHSCGPDSNCDGDCVDASRFADGMAEIQKALAPEPEKPTPEVKP